MQHKHSKRESCHLIVGGSGFIGRHVGLALAQRGARVILAGRTRPSFLDDLPGTQLVWRSLDTSAVDWDAQIEHVDVVHFYAWGSLPSTANDNPKADIDCNLGALLGLLDALKRRGHGRVVFASSGGTVYGPLKQVPVVETHEMAPITAYGAGKAAAEIYLNLYRAMHGLDCRIARIANPFGAGQNISRGLGVVTAFVKKALDGELIEIWGTGEVVRDFIHIADAADCLACLSMADDLQGHTVFNVGSGKGTSLNEIVAALEASFQRKLIVHRKPGRAFDVPSNVLSIERARRVLGWYPQLTFADGLARMLSDLVEHPEISTLNNAEALRPLPLDTPL